MKSEKASACLEKCAIQSKDPYIGRYVLYHEAAICMDIAEEEAEKRVREELTRWHDPKEEAPEFLKDVLFKIRYRGCARIFYVVGYLKESGTIIGPCGPNYEIIGWREIHEYHA